MTTSWFTYDPKDQDLQAFLEANNIHKVEEIGALTVAQVEHYFKSSEPYHAILTTYPYIPEQSSWATAQWLTPSECITVWQEDIKSRVKTKRWDGFYDAWEWRTDTGVLILVFAYGYVPI